MKLRIRYLMEGFLIAISIIGYIVIRQVIGGMQLTKDFVPDSTELSSPAGHMESTVSFGYSDGLNDLDWLLAISTIFVFVIIYYVVRIGIDHLMKSNHKR